MAIAILAAAELISASAAADASCQRSDDDFYEPVVERSPNRLNDSTSKCSEKGWSATLWTEPEHWAWEQICSRQMVDFDKRYCPTGQRADLKSVDQDSRRHLRGEFLRQILETNAFASEIESQPITIVGASIDYVDIADTKLASLVLSRTRVAGNVSLTNVTLGRTIILSQSEVAGELNFKRVSGGDIAISGTKLTQVSAEQLDLTRLRLTGNTVQNLKIDLSRLSEQLSILMGEYDSIWLSSSESNGLFVRLGKLRDFHLTDYVDQGMFIIDIQKWADDSVLFLYTVSVGTFRLFGADRLEKSNRSVPSRTQVSGFTFADGNWGDHPLPYLKALMRTSRDYVPSIYTSLAKSYAAAGRPDLARDILIAQSDAELHSATTTGLRKSYLWATRYLVAYGYRPEIGLAWIFVFACLGALVFRSGYHAIIAGKRPRSWFVFALDAVIPGISLDGEHSKLVFAGWPPVVSLFSSFSRRGCCRVDSQPHQKRHFWNGMISGNRFKMRCKDIQCSSAQ